MDKNYQNFIQAINEKKIVKLEFSSKEKGDSVRMCIPFDFWPSRKYNDWLNRYHFYDLDSPEWSHNLSILPDQIISITMTDIIFEPNDYVTRTPNRFIKRDWWIYS